MIPEDAGGVLLPVARRAIADRLRLPGPPEPEADWLDEPGATFVTLILSGRLRGCIGSLEAHQGVGRDVRANALAAAFRDPRFPPLTETEFRDVGVEVSLLTPAERIAASSEADAVAQLRPHVDGVILTSGRHRGTFLPQVWEQLPDPADFLAHLKRKAGLPDDHWDAGVLLERYTVRKWTE